MSSLALMRWLENTPARYDRGMRVITLGRVAELHEALVAAATQKADARVLEIGCGTGAVTLRLAERGAHGIGLDQNPEMLERARTRLADAAMERFELVEKTASEIDTLPEFAFDAVVAGFSLSEMSTGERGFVLREAAKRLAPDGVLVIADEVLPQRAAARLLYCLLRFPQAALGWLLAGSLSRPLAHLSSEISDGGFEAPHESRWLLGSLGLFVARRRE